jgi:hypothetical protein
MEVATVLVATVALRFFSFTFLTFPLAFSLWYLSMDLTPLVFGKNQFSFDQEKLVSVFFGLAVLLASFVVDKRCRKNDFAFWTYLYGLIAFWGGLSAMHSDSEINKLNYCLLNLVLMLAAVYLRRRVFMVFGVMGVLGYTGHLAWEVFKDSFAFPLILAFLGLFVVFLGVKFQRNKDRIEAAVESVFPTFLMEWRPEERA